MTITSILFSLASFTPSILAIPLSTVIITSGFFNNACSTIFGVRPYPNLNLFGTKKSTLAENFLKPKTAHADAVAPSTS